MVVEENGFWIWISEENYKIVFDWLVAVVVAVATYVVRTFKLFNKLT